MANAEFMYEYFIRVPFSNGTTEEILAGRTSFQPLYDHAGTPPRPSSETIGLEPRHIGVPRKHPPITNYTAQVSGLAFTQRNVHLDGVALNINYQAPKIRSSPWSLPEPDLRAPSLHR